MKVCLILSGSIAAYKACELASLLVKAGHEVQCVASEAALRFVGSASLEGLTDRTVYTDLWAPRESKTHISLRRWADLFVFYPATANRINQLATGLAPDLIGATFLANNFEKPFWIAPAMNSNMLAHPATQAALRTLESWGCRLLWGESGRLACGDNGLGRLADARQVFGLIQREFAVPAAPQPGTGRLLLTGGAMSEAIDGVRAITNSSSGRTAAAIARAFLGAGWSVDFLHHRTADLGGLDETAEAGTLRLLAYEGFADFRDRLMACLADTEYQAVVHAAAVSDYRVGRVSQEGENPVGRPAKLESGQALMVELLPNPKLLPEIRTRAKGRPWIAAFKLTVGDTEAEGARRAAAFLASGQADAVVWNDMAQMGRSAGTASATGSAHPFVVYGPRGELGRGADNAALASALMQALAAGGKGADTHE